jgi:hypothetical protein
LYFLFLILGAGVTPAEGSVKPTAGFTLNNVISPSAVSRNAALTWIPRDVTICAELLCLNLK